LSMFGSADDATQESASAPDATALHVTDTTYSSGKRGNLAARRLLPNTGRAQWQGMNIHPGIVFLSSAALLTIAQAHSVRKKIPRLPAARGNSFGLVRSPRTVQSIRLLIVGDSSALGVGVEHSRDALAAHIARHLASRTGRNVCWRFTGEVGATLRRIRERLAPDTLDEYDFVVIAAGVNDAIRLRSPLAWRREMRNLVELLQSRTSCRAVFVSPLPPIWKFRALPIPLRLVLGAHTLVLNAMTRALARKRTDITHASIPLADQSTMLGEDRFHPSSYGYSTWARHVADHLAAIPSPAHSELVDRVHICAGKPAVNTDVRATERTGSMSPHSAALTKRRSER
jgi:lysophospholipase L1-like esterase